MKAIQTALRCASASTSTLTAMLFLAAVPGMAFAKSAPVLPVDSPAPVAIAISPAELLQSRPTNADAANPKTVPVPNPIAPVVPVPPVVPGVDTAPWLYKGSDIPQDTGWQFGALKNGLRFAVRNNDVPAGQVSIRVRVDAGSMMENADELGFAHFLEHLSFRGTDKVDDGEIKRTWQRLGATFGSDSNAQTTPTQTVYQLDLPSITEVKLDESFALLAGMMRSPRIDTATVDSEVKVVMAELRESYGPQGRVSDANRELLFAGTLLATRPTGGTEATLRAATADRVAAFHARHYRPEKMVIAVAGDMKPEVFARLIQKHFGDWQGKPGAAPDTNFGKPNVKAPVARIVIEPTQPLMVTYAKVRPFVKITDSIAYTQGLYHDYLALAVINRRLEKRARAADASFLYAQVQQDKINRAVDVTSVSLAPLDKNWTKAVADVRAVIADALLTPPTAEDIAREAREIDAAITADAANARNQSGSDLVDDMVRAVDIAETVAAPAEHLKLFRSSLPAATPKQILKTTQKLFSGDATRILLVQPDGLAAAPGLDQKLALAATAPIKPDTTSRIKKSTISIASLPALGKPGSVVSTAPISGLGVDILTLDNGVKAMVANNPLEPDKVRITVRFGGGRDALAADKPNLLWSGGYTMMSSGIGALREDDLDQITNGRNLGMGFEIDADAYELTAETTPADLADQLRLLVAKLNSPGWDAQAVRRSRAAMLLGYATQSASPVDVLQRDLSGAVRNNDPRWVAPTKAQIEALTPENFRSFWEPILKQGPIEVQMFGDLQSVDYAKILGETFGAMPARTMPPVAAAVKPVASAPGKAPVQLFHSGDSNQAAAVLSWPTQGGIVDAEEARKLDVLAAIISDRLFDQLRSQLGATYSPAVVSDWPLRANTGGQFFIESQLQPKDTGVFFKVVRAIAQDLATKPVTQDELERASKPLQEQIVRAASGNQFWMLELKGASRDTRRVTALRSYVRDVASTTPADIQALAVKYLKADAGVEVVVLPQAKIAAAGGSAPAAK